MSRKTKSAPQANYVKTFNDGVVYANIFRGCNPDGHAYLYYELSRFWKSGKREGHARKFYERDDESLVSVITMASRWIEEHPEAADGSAPPDKSPERPVSTFTQAA